MAEEKNESQVRILCFFIIFKIRFIFLALISVSVESNKKIIFIIDDDEETLHLLNEILNKYFIIYSFKRADEIFFKFLISVKPNLIILNWILPTTNADEVINQTRLIYGLSTKIMVMPESTNFKRIFAGKSIDLILAKPFNLKKSKRYIASLLDLKPDYLNQ